MPFVVEHRNKITPSYVAWDEHSTLLVGNAAKNQAGLNPTRTIYDVKRLIGRKYVPMPVPQSTQQYRHFKALRMRGFIESLAYYKPHPVPMALSCPSLVPASIQTLAPTYSGLTILRSKQT